MFKAIRTDLKEFYNKVQQDTFEKVKVDSYLSSDFKEFYADFYLDTSKAVQQVKHDTMKVFDTLDDRISSELLLSWNHNDAVQEAEFRMAMEETYTTPLLKAEQEPEKSTDIESVDSKLEFEAGETQKFLKAFNIKQRTKEIVAILEARPDTVKVHFEALVPVNVSYEDFWQRYFFRCNVDRIVRVWTANDERIRSTRKAAMGALKKTLVTPVSAVVKPLKSAITWDYEDAMLEAEFRMTLDEVFLTPLLKPQLVVEESKEMEGDNLDFEFEAKETQKFIEAFIITQKTEEITALLEKHPHTLKARFEDLVPVQVSYEDFWERFFFRCDVDRIVRVWTAKDERIRAARKEAVGVWTKALGKPVSLVAAFVSISKTLDSKTIELEVTKASLEVRKDRVQSVQKKIASSNNKMLALRAKLNETKKCLFDAKKRVRGLKSDLRTAQIALRCKGRDGPDAASVRSSCETPDLTSGGCEEASVGNNFSFSNEGDISSVTESSYTSLTDSDNSNVPVVECHAVQEDSTSRSLESESLTEFEEVKEDPEKRPEKSPASLFNRLNLDISSIGKLASLNDFWMAKEDTVKDGWDHDKETW